MLTVLFSNLGVSMTLNQILKRLETLQEIAAEIEGTLLLQDKKFLDSSVDIEVLSLADKMTDVIHNIDEIESSLRNLMKEMMKKK